MRTLASSLVICLLSLFPQQLPSVTEVGVVAGIVVDNTGSVIPGATVTLLGALRIVRATTTTNERGEFRFAPIPPGTYDLEAELEGFRTVWLEVIVGAAIMQPLRLTLEVGGVQETVRPPGRR